LIDAIEGHLYARADEDLSRQRQVSGEGWIWERNELHVEGPMSNALSAGRTTLRIDDVEAVDTVDGHLSVWKTGDEEPAVRIPVTARNCRLLSQLLHSRLPARRGDFSSDNAAENTDGLGRMLFERRRSLLPVMLFWLLAVCVGLGSAMLFGLAIAFGDLPLWIMGGVFGLASLLLAWWGTRCRRMTFRCHEFGLCRVGPLATRTIRYRDVAIVRYRALRQFVHGTYAGTSVMLTVGTNGETRVEAVTYTTTWKRPDAELLRLRDQVATIVAQRMLDQLKAGRTVEWTPLLRFRPDALVFQPKRRLGRDKAPVTIPYDAVNQFNIDNGRFHLWTNYQERAVLAEETSEPNFYAGLIVLGHLCELPVGESV
jgi:hypothetical protein